LAAAKSQQAGVHPAEAAIQAKKLVTYEHGAMFLEFHNKPQKALPRGIFGRSFGLQPSRLVDTWPKPMESQSCIHKSKKSFQAHRRAQTCRV